MTNLQTLNIIRVKRTSVFKRAATVGCFFLELDDHKCTLCVHTHTRAESLDFRQRHG